MLRRQRLRIDGERLAGGCLGGGYIVGLEILTGQRVQIVAGEVMIGTESFLGTVYGAFRRFDSLGDLSASRIKVAQM